MPLFWTSRLQTASLGFCFQPYASFMILCAPIEGVVPLSCFPLLSRTGFTHRSPCLHPVSHGHSSFTSYPEATASVPRLADHSGLFCSCALSLEKRKCSHRQLGGSKIAVTGRSLVCWQPLLGPCRDHVCFFHCDTTLKNDCF